MSDPSKPQRPELDPGRSRPPDRQAFRIYIDGPIEAVWHEITRTDVPQKTFFNMRMHVGAFEPGRELQMRTPSNKYVGVVGEILEFQPPHRFSHTFKFTNLDDPPCRVTYELTEQDGGTLFTMILDELPVGTKTAKQMVSGSTLILNTLKAVVETGRPTFGQRMIHRMIGLFEFVSPKQTRVEHWPLKSSSFSGHHPSA
jgi:uncharacterized protein YndB with AHSA1/START domain